MNLSTATAGRDLSLGDRLGHEHGCLEVRFVDAIEGLLGDLEQGLLDLDADAVDENIKAAELLVRFGCGRLDGAQVSHLDRNSKYLRLCSGRDGLRQPLRLSAVACPDGDGGAGERQAPADRLAETAGAAGHEGGLAGEVEEPGDRKSTR